MNYVVKQKHKTKTKEKSQPNNAMNPNYVFSRGLFFSVEYSKLHRNICCELVKAYERCVFRKKIQM